jgi:KDO2-lipid IV(A) lauroyltransferase
MGQQMRLTKRVRIRIEYIAAKALLWGASFIPLPMLRRVGAGLGWVAYRVIGIRRRIAVHNIVSSLAGLDRRAAEEIALESYKNFGRSMMEVITFGRITAERLWEMVTVEGQENPDEALAHGKGAIIYTGHFGNWELLGAAIARGGYPVHATDTGHTNRRTHRMIIDLRNAQGVNVLAPDQPFSSILQLLSDNQFVAYVADQDAGRSGIFVDFLGRPASTRRGPALLAIRKGCPIAPVFIVRERNDHHRVIYGKLIWPNPQLKGRAAVVDLTERCTRVLEDMIRRYPQMYFWVHRRWKTKPAEPPA